MPTWPKRPGAMLTAKRIRYLAGAGGLRSPSCVAPAATWARPTAGKTWRENFRMDYQFDCAPHGNIALTGELDIRQEPRVCVRAWPSARACTEGAVTAAQALGIFFAQQLCGSSSSGACVPSLAGGGKGDRRRRLPVSRQPRHPPGPRRQNLRRGLDRLAEYPVGRVRGGENLGGYHLVWTRDMCQSARRTAGRRQLQVALRAHPTWRVPRRKTLAASFRNFWIRGEPYWCGTQLDETAFPVILAWCLHQAQRCRLLTRIAMAAQAACFLVEHGPVTPQERWEEDSGYSPSMLAPRLRPGCARRHCAPRSDHTAPRHNTWRSMPTSSRHLECVDGDQTAGTLVPGIPRHLHPHPPRRSERSAARRRCQPRRSGI